VIVAGALTLGLVLYAGTRLWAQNPATGGGAGAAPAVSMRMRMVNLQYVIKSYKRTESLRAEHTALFKKYDDELKELKKLSDARTQQMQDPSLTAAQKEAVEKEIKRLQREMKEKSDDAQMALAKKEGDLITLIYSEVEDAVVRYATSHQLDLVLHYNDAVAEVDRKNPQNVARKMSAGACMPMYMAPGLDISKDIVDQLNAKYPGSAQAPGMGPSGVHQ
jgi:Skp family chaperone for outer membrane proteins